MTRKQKEAMIRKLSREMLANSYREMKVKIDLAIKSGAIDIDAYPGDYILPKAVTAAVLSSARHQYLCKGSRFEKQIEFDMVNLSFFI